MADQSVNMTLKPHDGRSWNCISKWELKNGNEEYTYYNSFIINKTIYFQGNSHFLLIKVSQPLLFPLKESLGLEKKTTVSKALVQSSNLGENRTLGPALMLQACCIYLGLITPCPETFPPLQLPRRLITPCPTANAISAEDETKHPAWLTFPLSLPWWLRG